MSVTRGELRTCPRGHRYRKSSDCPTCPTCESDRRPDDGMLANLVAPARRALESVGATTPEALARFSEAEILAIHGMGRASIPKLRAALAERGLAFRDDG